ncbi:MAG: bifunctional nicotinamidase/pyrazinamidase [Candidatus Rifleibacteriota bacterium]
MKALLLVDLQNDFMPGGNLAVKEGDSVVPVANCLGKHFNIVVATQDWHPGDHSSFAANHPGKKPGDVVNLNGFPQVLWPVHCVQDTDGADFHKNLKLNQITKVFKKGTHKEVDSYSGFFDNNRAHSTGLSEWLKSHGVDTLYIMGLATDYCVKFTALDAVEQGFKTFLITDGCKGVELNTGDISKALEEMQQAGVAFISAREMQTACIEKV